MSEDEIVPELEVTKHTVTQEELDADPTLAANGVKVGDVIEDVPEVAE